MLKMPKHVKNVKKFFKDVKKVKKCQSESKFVYKLQLKIIILLSHPTGMVTCMIPRMSQV